MIACTDGFESFIAVLDLRLRLAALASCLLRLDLLARLLVL
jgi:hypothetical protein